MTDQNTTGEPAASGYVQRQNPDGTWTISEQLARDLNGELTSLREKVGKHEANAPISLEEQQRRWGSELLDGLDGRPPAP